jgi:hypothetical protein
MAVLKIKRRISVESIQRTGRGLKSLAAVEVRLLYLRDRTLPGGLGQLSRIKGVLAFRI